MPFKDDFTDDVQEMERIEYGDRFPPGWLAEEFKRAKARLAENARIIEEADRNVRLLTQKMAERRANV